jgi:hypothetical protein
MLAVPCDRSEIVVSRGDPAGVVSTRTLVTTSHAVRKEPDVGQVLRVNANSSTARLLGFSSP